MTESPTHDELVGMMREVVENGGNARLVQDRLGNNDEYNEAWYVLSDISAAGRKASRWISMYE